MAVGRILGNGHFLRARTSRLLDPEEHRAQSHKQDRAARFHDELLVYVYPLFFAKTIFYGENQGVSESTPRSGSLGFKLVLGVTLLVAVLMGSSFFLAYNFLKEETRAFTFEVQANQSQLLGQRFSHVIDTVIHTLKVLPGLDRQSLLALENQDAILSLEVFETESQPGNSVRAIVSWRGDRSHALPDHELVAELLASGVAYETRSMKDHSELYLYTLFDSDRRKSKLTFIRSRINPGTILKKSAGTDARILTRGGKSLLDTRNSGPSGGVDPQDPLYQAARNSPVSTGTLEYTPKDGDPRLGTYILPGYQVIILNSVRAKDAMRGTYILLERMLLVGLVLLGGALVMVVLFSLKITEPLKKLTRATQVISKGDFELHLAETATDEIGHLSRSMNRMSEKIKGLLEERVEKVRLEQELAIASNLQHRLIPPTEIKLNRYSLLSHYQSAAECGGDWWGYFEAGDRVILTISDATGHGLPPAMLTAVMHGCFSAFRRVLSAVSASHLSPTHLLEMANDVIVDSGKGEINMTMFVAIIDMNSGTLSYANAGHHTPWVIRKNPNSGESDLISLRARGTRLGEKEGFAPSEMKEIAFGPDDGLLLYTDGLIENTGVDHTPFGKDRLKRHFAHSASSWAETHHQLVEEIRQFYGDRHPADDLTYVLFRMNGTGGEDTRA
jgi:sigma-B regulation protein RsbU (phosphoserine phosphatase)